MAGRMQGKVVLVTGAGSGIGRASALAFAREGAKVVVSDIDAAGGEETVRLARAAGGEAAFIRADVTKSAEVEALVAQAVARFGRLDAAHNNAGISGARGPAADLAEDDWDRVHDTNLKGTWRCVKHEVRQMLKQGSGAIVNTSAASALAGSKGSSTYMAAVAGVLGLTRSAALDYAEAGIRINAVCPGVIDTPLIRKMMSANPQAEAQFAARVPMKRLGKPEEIAELVVWLCSDAASYVTGQAFLADGGMVMR